MYILVHLHCVYIIGPRTVAMRPFYLRYAKHLMGGLRVSHICHIQNHSTNATFDNRHFRLIFVHTSLIRFENMCSNVEEYFCHSRSRWQRTSETIRIK